MTAQTRRQYFLTTLQPTFNATPDETFATLYAQLSSALRPQGYDATQAQASTFVLNKAGLLSELSLDKAEADGERLKWSVNVCLRASLSSRLFSHASALQARMEQHLNELEATLSNLPVACELERPARQRPLRVRDQTKLAIFYGVLLGTDTSAYVELECLESLSPQQRERWADAPLPNVGPWGVYWVGYRSGAVALPSLILVHRPSAIGAWWFDEEHAGVENTGHLSLAPNMLLSPALSAQDDAALSQLEAALGLEVRARLGWQALSIVDLKHT